MLIVFFFLIFYAKQLINQSIRKSTLVYYNKQNRFLKRMWEKKTRFTRTINNRFCITNNHAKSPDISIVCHFACIVTCDCCNSRKFLPTSLCTRLSERSEWVEDRAREKQNERRWEKDRRKQSTILNIYRMKFCVHHTKVIAYKP